jgi:hypothetical protein
LDSVTEATTAGSALSIGKLFDQLLKVGFFSAITVATIGWVAAFGWIVVRLANWLMA